MNKRFGFTIIELMVVVSIIGILGSVIYASFGGAREEARNRAMMAELRETQLALEVYRAQQDQYPTALTDLIPEFITELPDADNSNNGSCSIVYQVDTTDYSWYKLTAEECFEGASEASEGLGFDSEFARCPDTCSTCAGETGSYETAAAFYESMAVYSGGVDGTTPVSCL